MSSCLGPKFIRVVAGLATQSSQSISSSNRARRPEQPMQSRFLPSRIPVPSPRNTYSYPSSNIALPATSPTPSRKPISVPTSSSRKTEDSILKHVERVSHFLILIARIGPIAIFAVAVADLLSSSPGRRILADCDRSCVRFRLPSPPTKPQHSRQRRRLPNLSHDLSLDQLLVSHPLIRLCHHHHHQSPALTPRLMHTFSG